MEIVNKNKEEKTITEAELLKSAICDYVSTRDYSEDIKITVQDAMIYYNRSLAKYNLDDLEGALDDLNASLSIYELDQAYYQLFTIYNQQNKPQEAMEYLIKSYKLGNLDAVSILANNTDYFN